METLGQKLVTAKEISLKFDISYPTINHYTNLGFFSIAKMRGNRRLYREREVKVCLDKISRWKDEGYPLRLILRMLKKER